MICDIKRAHLSGGAKYEKPKRRVLPDGQRSDGLATTMTAKRSFDPSGAGEPLAQKAGGESFRNGPGPQFVSELT